MPATDGTGEKGSEGATDSRAGVAALLAVAEAHIGDPATTVALRLLRRRENGLNGSRPVPPVSTSIPDVAKMLLQPW